MTTWTDHGSGINLPTGDDLTAPDVTPEDRHRASLAVCELAKDAADARLLLVMLGLAVES